MLISLVSVELLNESVILFWFIFQKDKDKASAMFQKIATAYEVSSTK